ncbi:MAG: class aldolase [Rhodospirillales bacterium]|jgi:ribulose-5-phosphate 4-epimerase/fuculose-1-phosphate aldolase|nr:class aldolase [Rhodospirillales bacterium]
MRLANVSEAMAVEQQLRIELAAAYRLIDHFGWTTLIFNHLTMRVPGPTRQFLINPFGLRYDEITASSLVKIAIDGEIVEPGSGEFGRTINPAGWVIHRAIHQARDDAHCVMHTHTIAGSAVSALECGLLPVTLESMGFIGKVGYHDYEGVTVEDDEGPRLVADIGDSNVLILRNHGLLVAGKTVGEAFYRLFNLERACQVQIAAMSAGSKLVQPTPSVFGNSRRQQGQTTAGLPNAERAFRAFMRLMDEKDPSYRE